MNISPTIQKAFGRSLLAIQKNSPAILTTIGVASVVTAGVLAARNTLRLEETIDQGQGRLVAVNDLIEQGEAEESARTKVYVRNIFEVVKLYALPGSLMLGGIVCTLGANRILTKRNAALAAAYNGLAASFEAYRERVREEYGDEVEKDIYLGQRDSFVEDENGKKKKIKVPVDGEHVGSPYRFRYGIDNENWSGFHDENLHRVMIVQTMFNDRLKQRGHVVLHEVLDVLGIERTEASFVTGWRYVDPNSPEFADHQGDNFIEFNLRDFQSEYGYLLLDMNVDGLIYNKIK